MVAVHDASLELLDSCSDRAQLPSEQIVLERKQGQSLAAGVCDQQLLFEIDPLQSIHFADITLDTDDHSGLENPLAAALAEILRVRYERRLTVHPNAVHHRCVAALHEAFRYLPGALGELAITGAGARDGNVVLYL